MLARLAATAIGDRSGAGSGAAPRAGGGAALRAEIKVQGTVIQLKLTALLWVHVPL